MGKDADVVSLLALAMGTSSPIRKAAALLLASAIRRNDVACEDIDHVCTKAGRLHSDAVVAEMRQIASELHLA